MTAGTACGKAPRQARLCCVLCTGHNQHQLIISMAQLGDERAKGSSYQHSVQRERCVRATAELQSVFQHTLAVHILRLLVPGICSAFRVPLSTSDQYGRKYKHPFNINTNTNTILIFPFINRHDKVRTVQQIGREFQPIEDRVGLAR